MLLLPDELDDEELLTAEGALLRDVVTVDREVAVDVRGDATVTVSPLRLFPDNSVVLGRVLIMSEVRDVVVVLVPVDLKVDSLRFTALSCDRTADDPLPVVEIERSTTRTERSDETTEFRVTTVLSFVRPTLVEEPEMV